MREHKSTAGGLLIEERKSIITLMLNYDLLRHAALRNAFKSEVMFSANKELGARGTWEVIYCLCELTLTETPVVITDFSTIISLSDSTIRRTINALEKINVVEKIKDKKDHRRIFVTLTKVFQAILSQYVDKCAEDFKGLIQHHDKRGRDVVKAALRKSEERFKGLYENAPVMMQSIDRSGVITKVNKKWLEVLKYDLDEVIGRKSVSFLTNKSREYAEKIVQPKFFESGICEDVHYQYISKLDDIIDVKLSATAERDDEGNVIASRAVLVDETKELHAEAALLESEKDFKELYEKSEENLRSLFHNIGTCVATLTAVDGGEDFIYTDFNPAAEKADNIKKEKLLGRRISEVFPCVKDVGILDAYRRVWKTGQSEHHPLTLFKDIRAEGWQKHFLYKLRSGEVVAIYNDLTELKKTRAALCDSEIQLRNIFSTSPEMLIVTDDKMNIILFNKEAERHTGYRAKEVINRSIDLLIPRRFHDKHKEYVKEFDESLNSNLHMDQREDIYCLKKDGTEFPALGSVSKREINGNKRFIVALRDISARRVAEEGQRKALVKAELANKAKSDFLASMSHDLRTPLNAILGFSDILNEEMFGPIGSKKYKEYANDIHNSGQFLLELVNDVLDVSTIEAGKRVINKEQVNLSALIEESIKTVSKLAWDKRVSLTLHLPDYLPPLNADERSVTQIVHNLLSNAIKFTKPNGKIFVSVEVDTEHMFIVVKDTGVGIPKDKINKVVQPFSQVISNPYNTQEGTGLGLFIVKSLVEMHDGSIDIKSKVGEGSTITVSFARQRQSEIWSEYK